MKIKREDLVKYFRETNETRVQKPSSVSFSLLAAFFGNASFEPRSLYRFSLNLSTFEDNPERN